MAGLRWGIIAAVAAFVISFGLGLISGNQFLRVFLTAFVFGFLFFGMGFGLKIIINSFFPEFMFMDNRTESADDYEQEKEHVNITLENSGEYAVPEMYKIPGETPELGNIEDLVSGTFKSRKEGIDSIPEEVYNEVGAPVFLEPEEKASESSVPQQVFTPSFGDDEGLGGLPDLDAFTLAFSGGSGVSSGTLDRAAIQESPAQFFPGLEPAVHVQQPEEEPDRTQYKGNKSQTLEGNFDAKEIAKGLRTLISKDK